LTDWLLLVGSVFAINLLPAFGPPTWAVLVFFRLNSDLPAVPLVLLGALAAASGRLVLASVTRHFRGRFSAERRANLQAAEELLVGSRAKAAAGLGLFALSPVPSAQLFVAAGLLTVPLVPLTAAFFVGRLVSYSFYVAAASAAKESLGDVLVDVIGSPWGIAIQVALLAGLVLLFRLDWVSLLESRRRRHDAQVGTVGAVQPTAERDECHGAGDQRQPEEDDPVQQDRRGGDRRGRAVDDQRADQAAVDPSEAAR
jgi:membrane protein YqaA with SNARE-associated domain